MGLMDDVTALWRRLSDSGWADVLAPHGLDLEAADLGGELVRPLSVDRSVAGFEDFAAEGQRAIEPGQPARSLLYHALASPNVVGPQGGDPEAMPTLHDIRTVENLVFGLRPPSLAQLRARFPGAPLALAVFAYDYRPAAETVHRRHADLCFARTGIARVGTVPATYDRAARGFATRSEDQTGIPVQPARYGAFVAAQLRGDRAAFGPLNTWVRGALFDEDDAAGDLQRLFWVPLHKLFSGAECLRDRDLRVTLRARHRNEKLRRIHLRADAEDGGTPEAELEEPPFAFEDGIAELSQHPDLGDGVLVPVTHDRLAEPAVRDGLPVTIRVPEGGETLFSSLNFPPDGRGHRSAPEFVHVRHQVTADGRLVDLNADPDVAGRVAEGGYHALHYVDFTGDGMVQAECPELAAELVRSVPAYSIVAAPDFFPHCSQRELLEWWLLELPSRLRDRIWVDRRFPTTLADHRLPANVQLPWSQFRAEDTTVTAIVAMPDTAGVEMPGGVSGARRHVDLPDAAAGVFAPGWDISFDGDGDTRHLAAYGLGSPFPEDAKLCAALSAFWPAAAPDAGRSFSQHFRTVTPQTDQEIGSTGDVPWDGTPGPRPAGDATYRFASFPHVDYVATALEGAFTSALTGEVDTREYIARTLALVRLHEALDIGAGDPAWRLLSFRVVADGDPELARAEEQSGRRIVGRAFRCVLGRASGQRPAPDDHREVIVTVDRELTAIVGAGAEILLREDGGAWQSREP